MTEPRGVPAVDHRHLNRRHLHGRGDSTPLRQASGTFVFRRGVLTMIGKGGPLPRFNKINGLEASQ
jgi:hypothetical protein